MSKNKEQLEKLYKGKYIELIFMLDKYANLKAGDKGKCIGVDDACNVLMKWNNGSKLSLIPEIDSFKIIETKRMLMLPFFKHN